MPDCPIDRDNTSMPVNNESKDSPCISERTTYCIIDEESFIMADATTASTYVFTLPGRRSNNTSYIATASCHSLLTKWSSAFLNTVRYGISAKAEKAILQKRKNPIIRLIYIHLIVTHYEQTKIAKGECRDKRKFYFRFGYTEPQPIFVLTKITNQLCNIGNTADKNKTDSPRNLQQSGK